ncbi:MAG TPA: hypothetical protein ENO21_00325 [Firmicutes bacterium]|nr:hypothetical protein [Bacillota bacterium]
MNQPPRRPDSAHPSKPPASAPAQSGRLASILEKILYRRRVGEAFWNLASLISMTMNVVLLAALILLGGQFFAIKDVVSNQLIGGLYDNFVKMDAASIVTTITVEDTITVQDTIPVVFDLPLNQDTNVILTQNTPINNATIFLNGARVPLNLVLPKGTALGIRLDMTVPVSQTIPVTLNVPIRMEVPVDIPLNQTELHEPFAGLQAVVGPYRELLAETPDSWKETPLCGDRAEWMCDWLIGWR